MRVYFFEPTCVVPDDPGEVVRGARPITDEDRARIREQDIERMMRRFRQEQERHRDYLCHT